MESKHLLIFPPVWRGNFHKVQGPARAASVLELRAREQAVQSVAPLVKERLQLGRREQAGGAAASAAAAPLLTLTLALSRQQDDPERLGSAIDEAQLALSIGEKLGRAGEVVTFEETGTYKLLFQVFADRPEELESFYEQTMAPLFCHRLQA